MSRIQVLPESVARRIAAGEVIERPASVVKELVENSIDAGARNIVIELDQGGRERIAVTDDGDGMSRDDVVLAFEPHATSKIRTEEDLLRVSTLGFRGEALPSIAAVSEIEVWTRRPSDASGTHLRLRASTPEELTDVGTSPGCRIEVRSLFFNTPVRRKFLKTSSTEASQVIQLVGRLALAYSGIGFTVVHDGRETLSLPRSDLRSRIRRILGRELERELHPIEADGIVRIEGFATHPHYSLPNPRNVLWFVNRRFVRDRMLQHALLGAYATLLPHGRFPASILLLGVRTDEVDVNVHPTKAEVRFRSSQPVYDALHRAIRKTFGSAVIGVTESTVPSPPLSRFGSVPISGDGRLRLVHRNGGPLEVRERELFAPGPLARLRIVGQLFEGYLVCEGDGEVVLIDQHAAHERVAFERLRLQRDRGRVESQPLLVPQTVEVSLGEVELFAGAREELAAAGLEIEPFGDRVVVVRALPALFPAGDAAPLVLAIAADLAEYGRSRALADKTMDLLATVACHSVVRVGQQLSESEIRSLLAAMDGIDLSTNCPHGRPVTATLSRAELERRFGR